MIWSLNPTRAARWRRRATSWGTRDALPSSMATARPDSRRFRIVAALDESEYAEIVLEHAIDQAARHERVDLHFVTVVDRAARVDPVRARLAETVLHGLETFGTSTSDWRSWMHVLVGSPAVETTSLAGDVRADLLVIGRFGVHDPRRSLADRMLALASCPTLVVNLKEDVVAPLCPECARVREDTSADRLFCPEHSTEGPLHIAALVSRPPSTRGGSVW